MRTQHRSGHQNIGRDREDLGRPRLSAAQRVLLAATTAGLALFATSCSVIIDTDISQCELNQDCKDLASKDKPVICNKSTKLCVSLITEECVKVVGDNGDGTVDEDAILIGSILTLSGDYATGGLAPRYAMELARQQIVTGEGGIPGSGNPKKIVLIECDDKSDPSAEQEIPVAAAKHLTEDVGVPAIIGGTGTGTTLEIANNVTIDKEVLLFSPTATGTTLTDLPADKGKDLVWRTAPSDAQQAKAMSAYIVELLKSQAIDLMTAKVFCINRDDAYGGGLGEAAAGYLRAPIPTVKRFAYNAEDNGQKDMKPILDQVFASGVAPDVVALVGYNETVTFMEGIESKAITLGKKPFYIYTDGGQNAGLFDAVNGKEDLRIRVAGTVPGQPESEPAYATFLGAFAAVPEFKPESGNTFGSAGAYDITYLLAYKAAYLLAQKKPVDGKNLAEQLKHVSAASPKVYVGTAAINSSFEIATSSLDFDFIGASGPLQFDPRSGEAVSDIQLWCIPSPVNNKITEAKNSGVYFDINSKLVGTVPAKCD
jgi:branched-chain amino acid transport system substrate-binding protein